MLKFKCVELALIIVQSSYNSFLEFLCKALFENINAVCSYFFFLDEAISTLRITNTRATERRNLLVTLTASSLRPGVYLFCSSFTRVPSKVSMN